MTPRLARALALAVLALGFAMSPAARADVVDDALAAYAHEPSVAALQDAAVRYADLAPERARSWQRRSRLSGLAPSLHVSVGRGAKILATTTTSDGADRIVVGDNSSWTFSVGGTFALDRLVFNREEVRLAREALRVGTRREALLTDVARLYFERRRLQALLRLAPPASAAEALGARLRIDELTAVLDGLTGGALSAGSAPPSTVPASGAAEDD